MILKTGDTSRETNLYFALQFFNRLETSGYLYINQLYNRLRILPAISYQLIFIVLVHGIKNIPFAGIMKLTIFQ